MAEKFRPRLISDVIGQDMVKNLVRRSLRNKKFPQFSLMYGPSGTGKSTMSEICGLSLTCESPDNGEPCCECSSCKNNLIALNSGRQSMNLCKINMGAIERNDFKQTIKEVFTLKPASGDNAVYIFEEIQSLTKDEQNILLEYISNIRKNIYVICCTTEPNRLRQELRNRAIKFQFKQLRTEEAITLLENVCTQKGVKKPASELSKYIVRSVRNCPREIVNTIDFFIDSESLDTDTLNEFLGYISNATYIEYFNKCRGDSYDFVQWLDEQDGNGYGNIVKGLRNFVIDCYGYIYGSNKQYFNTHEKHKLGEIFKDVKEETMFSIMEHFNGCKFDDDTSAKYCLIVGRRIFNHKSVKEVYKESKREAKRAELNSYEESRKEEKRVVSHELVTTESLDIILSGFQVVKE